MIDLTVDIETRSSNSLIVLGVDKYCESPDFRILMIAYQINDEEPRILDLVLGCNQAELSQFLRMLDDDLYIKYAHTARFERKCLSIQFKRPMPAEQWRCTMAASYRAGYPGSLGNVASVLGLSQQKDKRGEKCISYFSNPCKPTKTNGGRKWNQPYHDPELWKDYLNYCKQDVRTERAVHNKLKWLKPTLTEDQMWTLDQKINDRGLYVDVELCKAAVKMDLENIQNLKREATQLTGIHNPGSVAQLKAWLSEEFDEQITKLDADSLPDLIKRAPTDTAERLLTIRGLINKASVKKYAAILKGVCSDGRVYGTTTYHGARTGRFTAKRFQPHNLVKNDNPTVNELMPKIRQLVKDGNKNLLKLMFGSISYILSQLIRTAITASLGKVLIPSDFSAIEARVLAYLAGETWKIKAFKAGVDIYVATYSNMFGIPVDKVTKNERQVGKVCELYLGYQGSVGAMMRAKADKGQPVKEFPGVLRGDLKNALPEKEMKGMVDAWRAANPNIVAYWKKINTAALNCVRYGTTENVGDIVFSLKHGNMLITLPSKRSIVYPQAYISVITVPRKDEDGGPFDVESVVYMEMNDKKQWVAVPTYGGKLVENIVQAFARDLLVYKMLVLNYKGFDIVLHVHDEIVCEVLESEADEAIKAIDEIMCEPVSWARDLYIKADTYKTFYYLKKD